MTEAALILLLALAVVALAAERARGPVVVTTRQGESIRGQRVVAARFGVALEHAELLGGGHKLAGRVEIPRSNVAMVQRLPTERPAPAPAERKAEAA